MKWQQILTYTGGGSVSIFTIIFLVLNLSGMSYTVPSDQICDDCYDIIYVNSTVWEIKVEHAGSDKDIIFAKKMRSRTRWLNLDKINEFVDTNPKVVIEILVPTTKKYSTINHPEFGYLRPIKDGDSLIARKSQKYNPNGDKFIIHGITNGQTVKWGMAFDSFVMDGIDFDPIWYGPGFNIQQKIECVSEVVVDGRVPKYDTLNYTEPTYLTHLENRSQDTQTILPLYKLSKIWDNCTYYNVTNWYCEEALQYNGTYQYNVSITSKNGTKMLFYEKQVGWNPTYGSICKTDKSWIRINFSDKSLLMNYSRYGFNCTIRNKILRCDGCQDKKWGNCNAKLELGEVGWIMPNITTIFFSNGGRQMKLYKVIAVKNKDITIYSEENAFLHKLIEKFIIKLRNDN